MLAHDLVGKTLFLKVVDITVRSGSYCCSRCEADGGLQGKPGVLWDQEIYQGFQYNTDRTFFHTFELEKCMAGLSFADEKEAAKFQKRVAKEITKQGLGGSPGQGQALTEEQIRRLGLTEEQIRDKDTREFIISYIEQEKEEQRLKEEKERLEAYSNGNGSPTPPRKGSVSRVGRAPPPPPPPPLPPSAPPALPPAPPPSLPPGLPHPRGGMAARAGMLSPQATGGSSMGKKAPPPPPPRRGHVATHSAGSSSPPSRSPIPASPEPPHTRTPPQPPAPKFAFPPPLPDAGVYVRQPPQPPRAIPTPPAPPPPSAPPLPPKTPLEENDRSGHRFGLPPPSVPPTPVRAPPAPRLPVRSSGPPPPPRPPVELLAPPAHGMYQTCESTRARTD